MKITIIYREGVVDTYNVLREKAGDVIVHHLKNPNVISIVLVEEGEEICALMNEIEAIKDRFAIAELLEKDEGYVMLEREEEKVK